MIICSLGPWSSEFLGPGSSLPLGPKAEFGLTFFDVVLIGVLWWLGPARFENLTSHFGVV